MTLYEKIYTEVRKTLPKSTSEFVAHALSTMSKEDARRIFKVVDDE